MAIHVKLLKKEENPEVFYCKSLADSRFLMILRQIRLNLKTLSLTFFNPTFMKNKYLSLLALVILTFACTKPDEILDDFQVNISPTFYTYVVEVGIEDLVDPTVEITDPITITIGGKDAAVIYNIDGTKNYDVNFSTIQLMIPRDAEPTEGNPVEFTIRLEANNYQATELAFAVREGESFNSDVARMLNLNNLPNSIGSTSANGGIDPTTNTLAQPLVVNAGSQDSLAKIQITIPTDVKFLDADGNEIVGKRGGTGLNVNVLSLSDSSEASQQALPNGTGLIQLVEDADGNIDTVLLEQGSTFNITMDLDGVPVRGFSGGKTSGGVGTRMPITDDAWNVEFDRPYQEGDSVSLMSLSEGDANWEGDDRSFVIKKDPATDELYVDANITHLSWWRWWWRRWWRPTYYNRGIGGYYVDDQGQAAGHVSGYIRGRLSYFRRGRWRSCYLYTRGNFGPNWYRNPRRFWRTTSPYNPAVLTSSFSPATYNLTTENRGSYRVLKIQAKAQPVTLSYLLYCGKSNVKVDPPSGVKMWYREVGTQTWKWLYSFDGSASRTAQFPELKDGDFYDFRATYHSTVKDTLNVQVVDNRTYEVRIPNGACSALGI